MMFLFCIIVCNTTQCNLGDEIIVKGTEGNLFYMIKEGSVRVSDVGDGKTYLDHDLGPGEYFGERALLTGDPRAANIKAVTNCVLMVLDRLSFDSHLGPLKDVLNQNMIMRVLNSQKFFESMDANSKVKLAKAFVLETFLAGKGWVMSLIFKYHHLCLLLVLVVLVLVVVVVMLDVAEVQYDSHTHTLLYSPLLCSTIHHSHHSSPPLFFSSSFSSFPLSPFTLPLIIEKLQFIQTLRCCCCEGKRQKW